MSRHQPSPIIQFDAEQYEPGDTVSGTVTFTCDRDIRARWIKIYWKGRGVIFEKQPDGSHQTSWKLIEGEVYPWRADSQNNKIPTGTHRFQFSFDLPENINSSYVPQPGKRIYYVVKYYVKVKICIPFSFLDIRAQAFFQVVNGIPHPYARNAGFVTAPPRYQS